MATNYMKFSDDDLAKEVKKLTDQLNENNSGIQNLASDDWSDDLNGTLELLYTTQMVAKELEAAVFNMIGRR